ncbi:Type 1 glutamine amidotransferase-like domain-containing protein [Paraburkholderia sp. CNPSo 3076]|uniref:Type 1 glutamine amidotransferase-like domain-containing protein n=1 Tax=Paraburkholderia sp. CNPSo 3076 TaxID=2940936 RepID=UPI00225A2A19|nr:Type 1 glutamine amidotransferase-like domain-containing protein [Paraburkholderia sp. CNPSo 3076]MCX5539980.1 Type 1 glutamine amidotransferase-like domain-containing protein [Paraburkholderia sp. CNPSo 3076]
MQRILAIGGGGFMMEDSPSPIDRHITSLTGKLRPRICYLAMPSGDLPAHLDKLHAVYGSMGCETSHLVFFRQPDSRSIPVSHFRSKLLEQDTIYVGGGNTKSALAVWREWGLDTVSRETWERGVLLAGMSAGAITTSPHGFPPSIAIDDFAAAMFLGTSLDSVLSWRTGSTAYQAYRAGDTVIETALPAKQIGQ